MHEYVNYARQPLSFRFVDLRALDDSGGTYIFAGRIYSRGGEAILACGDRTRLSVIVFIWKRAESRTILRERVSLRIYVIPDTSFFRPDDCATRPLSRFFAG